MKAFAVTNPGIESVAAAEIGELINSENVSGSGGVMTFDVKDFRDFCTLAYRSQSISRVCYLICEFAVAKTIATTARNLKQELKDFRIKDGTDEDFVVECERHGSHDFTSHDF